MRQNWSALLDNPQIKKSADGIAKVLGNPGGLLDCMDEEIDAVVNLVKTVKEYCASR